MYFVDRNDAAEQLAQRLSGYRGRRPLILALSHSAVPIGRIVVEYLDGDLDIALMRKLTAPNNQTFAIGVVAESGWYELSDYAKDVGASESYIQHELITQQQKIRRERELLRSFGPIDVRGRLVIVVDDGMFTGSTMIATLRALRAARPSRLVCAIPVASQEALEQVKPIVDDLICLYIPSSFNSIAQFYRNFARVKESEVIACLRVSGERHVAEVNTSAPRRLNGWGH